MAQKLGAQKIISRYSIQPNFEERVLSSDRFIFCYSSLKYNGYFLPILHSMLLRLGKLMIKNSQETRNRRELPELDKEYL